MSRLTDFRDAFVRSGDFVRVIAVHGWVNIFIDALVLSLVTDTWGEAATLFLAWFLGAQTSGYAQEKQHRVEGRRQHARF